MSKQLNDVSAKRGKRPAPKPAGVAKQASSQLSSQRTAGSEQVDNGIKSRKNMQAVGDTGNCDESNSDFESNKNTMNLNSKMKYIKPHASKGAQDNTTKTAASSISSKKAPTQHAIISNINELIDKTSKLTKQNEALILSNDSDVGGAHKKPRQPKQRVGVSSKVSSSEKEYQKAKEKGNVGVFSLELSSI